jgi:hypothetical protein
VPWHPHDDDPQRKSQRVRAKSLRALSASAGPTFLSAVDYPTIPLATSPPQNWVVVTLLGGEQLPVISYFSHHTSMRDRQVLFAKTAELGDLQNTIDFLRSLESAWGPRQFRAA